MHKGPHDSPFLDLPVETSRSTRYDNDRLDAGFGIAGGQPSQPGEAGLISEHNRTGHDDRSNGLLAVGLCETQPIAVAGLRALLGACPDLDFSWSCDSLTTGLQLARSSPTKLLVLDKAFGMQTVLDALADIRAAGIATSVIVWGVGMTEAEALRFLQSGARGIVRKTSDLAALVACLRKVAAGGTWMEDYVFRDGGRSERGSRSELTPREQQVLDLVEQGMKNKDIARELGIRPGTVKIHLKHIFEKTGVRGRYGLALASLKERTGYSLSRAAG